MHTEQAKSQALEKLISNRIELSLPGAGDKSPQYTLSTTHQWLKQLEIPQENPIIQENNFLVAKVLRECLSFGNRILPKFPRQENGQFVDLGYMSHAYRTARTVISEFGVNDPLVIATAFFHDLYQLIHHQVLLENNSLDDEQVRQQTRIIIGNELNAHFNFDLGIYPREVFLKQLLANIEDIFVLESKYEQLGWQVQAEFEDEFIAASIENNLTPVEFAKLRKEIIQEFVHEKASDEGFYSLNDMFKYVLDSLQAYNSAGGSTLSSTSAGMAVVLAALAEAVDNHRHPTFDISPNAKLEDRLRQMRTGIVCNLLYTVLARTFQLPTAVREVGESMHHSFFPNQWRAFNLALSELSSIWLNQEVNNYFNVQLKLNLMGLNSFIDEVWSDLNLTDKVSKVSQVELERRKILFQQGAYDQPIIGDYEYAIIGDIKTPASIFAKWLKSSSHGSLANTPDPNSPKYLIHFSQSANWKKYLLGSTDIVRSTVVLGNELSKLVVEHGWPFAFEYKDEASEFGEADQNEVGLVENTTLVSTATQRLSNNFLPNRKTASIRTEAESWRIAPEVSPDGLVFFEYHQIVQLLNGHSHHGRYLETVPFEVKIESINQWESNQYGMQLHHLYKEKDLRIPTENEAEKEADTAYLLNLYLMISRELNSVTYDGALP